MKVLVLNCGSSSIKYKLYEMETKTVMAAGGIEKVGLAGAFLKTKLPVEEKIFGDIPTHDEGLQMIFNSLIDPEKGVLSSLKEIDAVGHRMVHGGEKFNQSVLLNDEVLKAFEECSELAPLHNPANLKGVKAVTELMPELPQVGVFDTAFHQTMPDYAYMYALPYDMYTKYHIRRYGFHGTSHRYVSQRVCEFLGCDIKDKKIITCHIGNGASIAAIQNGKCVDTSMGLTPLEGLMMGTRSGDIDAGAVSYLQKKLGLDADGVSNLLNKESGVAGVFGKSDMRELESAVLAGDPCGVKTLQMYNYRIKKYIGAYTAAMNGLDILVFTAGVGENQYGVRSGVCENMEYLGIKLDFAKNDSVRGEEAVISTPDSKVTVCLIPTDEELMLATDTMNIVLGKNV